MTEFEVVQSHLKSGPLSDIFQSHINSILIGPFESSFVMVQGSEGIYAYYKLIRTLYSKRRVKDNYTINDVKKVVNKIIIDSIGKDNISQNKAIREAERQLTTETPRIFEVVRKISGIKLSYGYRKIGPFAFQKGENAFREFRRGDTLKLFDKEIFTDYIVRFKVKSVTRERAIEIADNVFRSLECLFAFILGRKDCGHEVRVLRQTKENVLFHFVRSDRGEISLGGSRKNLVFDEIDLNDKYFLNKKVRNLFTLISAHEGLSGIEKRLQRAILWIGKGLLSGSSIESIICYCSALESMLVREKKTIVSPSIMASLSEYCAFLLGKDLDDKKRIIKAVKDIYSERSAGTHDGKIVSDPMIEDNALYISRELVFRILDLYSKKIKSEQDLVEFVDRQKYS